MTTHDALNCCDNPAPVTDMRGQVSLFYGEYHDSLHQVVICENCGTVLYDEAAEEAQRRHAEPLPF